MWSYSFIRHSTFLDYIIMLSSHHVNVTAIATTVDFGGKHPSQMFERVQNMPLHCEESKTSKRQ